jgi:biotin transport system ATP-binding protein
MTNGVAGSIRFEQVTLRRGARLLFDGLALELTERRVGLLGDNGAGKSSLLRMINGLLLPDSGCVRVDGADTRISRASLPAKVGFVFQNPDHQIVFPTVIEEVAFGFRERGASRANAEALARAALKRFGCANWASLAIQELSDGQKQRLCIIAIAALEPDILVMDEPFSSLDLPTKLDLMDFLMQLPQRIVLASHELDLLQRMDRVVCLSRGAVAADGAPGHVIASYRDAVHARRNGAPL